MSTSVRDACMYAVWAADSPSFPISSQLALLVSTRPSANTSKVMRSRSPPTRESSASARRAPRLWSRRTFSDAASITTEPSEGTP